MTESTRGRAPRRWWAGPLDVEGLALDAVGEARTAIARIAGARGRPVEVTTSPEVIAASYATAEHMRVDGRAVDPWAPHSGFFPAADGWVRLHGNFPHHAAAIDRALGIASADDLPHATRDLLADEVADRVTAAGGIATVVRTEQEWAAHPHGAATRDEPWRRITTGETRRPLGPGELPLSGVRVLDLTRVIAGPTCSQLLACLGADVLRIDPPQRPELLDQFLSNGMGKRSTEADLATDADRIRKDLLPSADVVLLGYRPGALSRFGLDPSSLATDRPDLVVASLSAWGESGPWGERAGFDSIVQAATGIADLYRRDGGRPGALAVQALDHSTGYVLAADVINLLADGTGGVVRTSLLGAARDLLARPRSVGENVELDVSTVTVDSPYGPIVTVPPAVCLDGQQLSHPIGGYGAAELAWR